MRPINYGRRISRESWVGSLDHWAKSRSVDFPKASAEDAKLCGYKKGEFNIYEDGKYFGKVKYEKGCCSKNFYRFEDAEGIMVSKMKLKGTCNETLEKCCCCPCCWIACCTCKNCKTKPISRTLAPTWKSRVEVYAKVREKKQTLPT